MSKTLQPIRIIGIDPGLNHTGFGVIETRAKSFHLITAGCIHVPKGSLGERLRFIYEKLAGIIEETQPTHAACEIIFLNTNPKTTLLLGQARGAALTCLATHGLTVEEFTPSEIKKAVVGTGAADKVQVQHMVSQFLGLSGGLQSDAADALACAITLGHNLHLQTLTAGISSTQNALRKLQEQISRTNRNTQSNRNQWAQYIARRNKG